MAPAVRGVVDFALHGWQERSPSRQDAVDALHERAQPIVIDAQHAPGVRTVGTSMSVRSDNLRVDVTATRANRSACRPGGKASVEQEIAVIGTIGRVAHINPDVR